MLWTLILKMQVEWLRRENKCYVSRMNVLPSKNIGTSIMQNQMEKSMSTKSLMVRQISRSTTYDDSQITKYTRSFNFKHWFLIICFLAWFLFPFFQFFYFVIAKSNLQYFFFFATFKIFLDFLLLFMKETFCFLHFIYFWEHIFLLKTTES